MQGELVCEGKVRVGKLPWAVSERLAEFAGNWLAYAPAENAVIVRRGQPSGCPALTGVPCELITLLDLIPSDQRECMPGGSFCIKDKSGRMLTLTVERGEVRVQWPPTGKLASRLPVVGTAVEAVKGKPGEPRITGWARFAGSKASTRELQAFAERFKGLFPEGDLPSECEQNVVYVEFKGASIQEKELLQMMRTLADPPESLQAELDVVTSGTPVRLRIRDGAVERLRGGVADQP